MTAPSPSWSERSAAPPHLILEPSPSLRRALIAVHGLAIFAALANPLPFWLKVTLLAAVGFSFRQTYRDHVTEPAVHGLTRYADGTFEVIGRAGVITGTLAGSTVVTRWLVILHLDTATDRIAVLICRDATDPEAFRRLRVELRIAGQRREEDGA